MHGDEATRPMLDERAFDADPAVRVRAAADPLVAHSFAAMRALASDPAPGVRETLAANPHVPAVYLRAELRSHPALMPEHARVRRL